MDDKARQEWATRRGLKQSSRTCVQRLLGKRCNHENCQIPGAGDDHVTLWNYNGEPAVYVSQPYGLSHDEIKALVKFCDEHDLHLSIDTYPAWHNPGGVLHVEVSSLEWRGTAEGWVRAPVQRILIR